MKPLSQNTLVQNRYLIVHMIGKGGMGEVYLAVDQRLGSAVALKRTVFTDDEMLRAAFEREAKILGRLRHPVLPKVSDHFSENGDQFLVMEHISGDDLSKRLESSGKPFPLSWVMFWADQLLDALSYMHSHEPPIIHRDIKPQNLKLTDDNHIILLDFGLSKDQNASASPDQPMVSASVVGYTPHFAAMEQIRGTGTNARSDVYSFSATFYQLMTNVVPIDALARADAILSGGADPLVPPAEANPEVPKEISDIIVKGLQISQEKRYGTAAEMQKELRRAFKRTQAAMSAQTVAFASADEPTIAMDDPASHSTAAPSEAATQIQMSPVDESKAVTLPNAAGETQAPPRQEDVKTDVLPAGVIGDAAADAVNARPAEPSAAQPEAPKAEELPPTLADVAPAAQQPPPTPLVSQPQKAAAAAATVGPPPAAKKSRAGLVIGALAGVLVLAVVALGAGWYAYTNYYATVQQRSEPTPPPQMSPSPAPSIETVADSSRDVAEPGQEANTAEPSPADQQPAQTRPNQPATTKNPPAKTTGQPPAAKPPAKEKPKDERTVILQ